MSLYLRLVRSLRQTTNAHITLQTLTPHLNHRTFAFSSAEEAAAERRRRKRRLRIEPPLHALRRDPNNRPPPNPNAPRLPDSTSALVGPRLNLHNRVQSLIRAHDLNAASLIARQAVFSNTRPTVFTCNAIIAAMYRAKRYDDAVALFYYFFKQSDIVPNVVSYNNLINAHCDEGRVDKGLEVYKEILAEAPFSPSPVTYRHLTKGLVEQGRIGEGVDLLREMLGKGHGADSLVFNNLIKGFLELGNLEKAEELFDELKERCLVYDGVVSGTFMDWYFGKGMEKEGMEAYRSLLDREFRMVPATCNVLLEVLLKHGRKVEAWKLFEGMLDNHTPPTFQAVNSDTFSIMVNDFFKDGKVLEAKETFRKVGTKAGSKPFSMDVAGYNNMILRLCEHGMISEAEDIFKELCSKSLSPDVNTYRALIDAHLKVEQFDDALEYFNKMVVAGLRVVASFGNRVFEVLIENGKALQCAGILSKMGNNEPKPDFTCYDVVIRGLCNDNQLDAALDLVDQMMRYGVGIVPELKEFVTEVFGKVGRGEEIERVLNMSRGGYAPPSRAPQITGPPRGSQLHSAATFRPSGTQGGPPPYQPAGSFSPQMRRPPPYQPSGSFSPQMRGNSPPHTPATFSQQVGGSTPYSAAGQLPTQPYQAGGPSPPSSAGGPPPYGYSQMGGGPAPSSAGGPPPYGYSQMGGGPAPSQRTVNFPHEMRGPSPTQTEGQFSQMRGTPSSSGAGPLAYGSSQMAGPSPPQTRSFTPQQWGGPQPYEMAGQQQSGHPQLNGPLRPESAGTPPVPLNNYGYSTAPRSTMTQGNGEFTMEYKEHSPVSEEAQTQLINTYKASRAAE